MWTYFFGPFLSILPARWRGFLPLNVRWRPATTISGLAESVAALIAISYWYSHAMTTWVDRGVNSALSGKLGPGVTPQEIGSVALFVWATHPLTWLLGYAGIEGAVRAFAAAFSENAPGILLLFVFDKVLCLASGRPAPVGTNAAATSSNGPASFGGAIRERILVAKLPMVSDELSVRRDGGEEILEIHACRRKEDWVSPRIVRYQDHYYRLEADSLGKAPRPFHYRLRRLPAGVPGRSVLIYSPAETVVREQS